MSFSSVGFKFWGDSSNQGLVDLIKVRDTGNFNWTFIFILAVVFYVYWSEIHKKNYPAVQAGLALYGVHWYMKLRMQLSDALVVLHYGRLAINLQPLSF